MITEIPSKTSTNELERLTFLTEETSAEYHANRAKHLSSHWLRIYEKCPPLFQMMVLGQIEDETTRALKLGQAAHTFILEGTEIFARAYAVGGPINPQTGRPFGTDTQKFAKWEAEIGKTGVSVDEMALIERMNASIRDHATARDLLSQGLAERVVRHVVLGLPCQIRIDWLNPELGIADLKTCEDLDRFEFDSRKYGYLHQASFYQAVLEAASGVTVPFHFVVIEKQEPFRCGVWHVTEEALLMARMQNEQVMVRLKESNAKNHWPTGYEETRHLEMY